MQRILHKCVICLELINISNIRVKHKTEGWSGDIESNPNKGKILVRKDGGGLEWVYDFEVVRINDKNTPEKPIKKTDIRFFNG